MSPFPISSLNLTFFSAGGHFKYNLSTDQSISAIPSLFNANLEGDIYSLFFGIFSFGHLLYFPFKHSFSSSLPFIWYFLGVPRPGVMEPDCLVPGRTFPANPRFVVFRDNLPAAAFLELSSRTPSSSFQKQNLLFNSSHYSRGMHWPDPGIDMQRGGPEKILKNRISCYSLAVLCISGNWWRRPTVQALVTFPCKRLLRSVEGIWTDKVYKEININVTKIETLKISKRSHISIDTTRYVSWGILPGKKPQSGLATALLWTKTHFCYLNKLFFTHMNIACLSKSTSYKKEEFDPPSGLENLISMYQQSTSSTHLPYIYLLTSLHLIPRKKVRKFFLLSSLWHGGAVH